MRAVEWVRVRAAQLRDDPGAIGWMLMVAFVYGTATFVRSQASSWGPDHMMILASDLFVGRSDLSSLTTINDIVTIGDRHYQAMSLLPTVPYLVFVPFQALCRPMASKTSRRMAHEPPQIRWWLLRGRSEITSQFML